MTKPAPAARETKSQLARRLKIHRAQLDALLHRPGAPAPDKHKTYEVAAVIAHIADARDGSTLDTLRAARLREIGLRCEKLRQEIELSAKRAVSLADVDAFLKAEARRLTFHIYAGIESELPPKLDGLPAAQMRPMLREWADKLIDSMRTAEALIA